MVKTHFLMRWTGFKLFIKTVLSILPLLFFWYSYQYTQYQKRSTKERTPHSWKLGYHSMLDLWHLPSWCNCSWWARWNSIVFASVYSQQNFLRIHPHQFFYLLRVGQALNGLKIEVKTFFKKYAIYSLHRTLKKLSMYFVFPNGINRLFPCLMELQWF